MDRVARILRWLALGVAAAGGLASWWLFRPSSVAAWLDTFVLVLRPALGNPAVWIAAAVGVLSTLAARFFDVRPVEIRPRRKVHRAGASAGVTGVSDAVSAPATKGNPVSEGRTASPSDLAKARSRLELLLGKKPDVPAFVDQMLLTAIAARASDIHLQPLDLSTRLTYRIGGELQEIASLPQNRHEAVVRRLKVLSGLVTYRVEAPQDGRFTFDSPRGTADLRVSILPTHHGEKVVLRLVRVGAGLLPWEQLGMPESLRSRLESLLREPQGLIVLSGPTGSGKTTTLYSALQHLHQDRGTTTHLASIEDPIEVELPFISQTQVFRQVGLSFAEALRAVLRQDPNVLMIGEIRDPETAKIAVQAGLTGHLILTSIHADSAAGVCNRLIDLGIEPFMVSSALLATVSQRLARCLCPDCRHPASVPEPTVARLAAKGVAIDGLTFFRAEGCGACDGKGHRGRRAIFELVEMNGDLRRLITSRAPTDRIDEAAVGAGTVPLARAAVLAAAQGTLSLEEALRVAG